MNVKALASSGVSVSTQSSKAQRTAFVYGTLLCKPVLQTLLGRVPSMQEPAYLKDHKRFAIQNQVFPGTIPASDSTTTTSSSSSSSEVKGAVLLDLTEQEMMVLDWFEDEPDAYTRTPVQVEVPDSNSTSSSTMVISTEVYIYNNIEKDLDEQLEWDYEAFVANKLDWYMERVVRPCRTELEALTL